MWKTIPIDQNYEANELGDIRKIGSNQLVHQWLDKDGYKMVALTDRKLYRAHRLIAFTFLGNPENYPVVNHLNHNKQDNRVENLEWTTYQGNTIHSFSNHYRDDSVRAWSKQVQPKAAEASKRKVIQMDLDGNFIKRWDTLTQANKELEISISDICLCCQGKISYAGNYKWKYEKDVINNDN